MSSKELVSFRCRMKVITPIHIGDGKKYTKMDYVYVSKEVEEAKRKMEMNELKLEDISTKEGEEKYIRETYPMKREGENVIVVYNAPASTYEIPKKESNWGSFQEFLRKIFKK